MLIKLQKLGNSLVLILSQGLINKYHLNENDTLVVEEQDEGIFLNLQDPDFALWLRAYRKANIDYKEVLRELASQ